MALKLADAGVQLRTDLAEREVDLSGDLAHAHGSGERNERHHEGVFDQVLALLITKEVQKVLHVVSRLTQEMLASMTRALPNGN